MVISQKCNCCMHENVCAKSDKYKQSCIEVSNCIDSYRADIDVSIKCAHFVANSPFTIKGNDDLPQNRGDKK